MELNCWEDFATMHLDITTSTLENVHDDIRLRSSFEASIAVSGIGFIYCRIISCCTIICGRDETKKA